MLAQVPQERLYPPRRPARHRAGRRFISSFVEHYNTVRLYSAIGYITPKLLGNDKAIFAARNKNFFFSCVRPGARYFSANGSPTVALPE